MYDESGLLLNLIITEDKIYYVNKFNKKYDIKQDVLYDKILEYTNMFEIYKTYIQNAIYDRSIPRIILKCHNCDNTLLHYVILPFDIKPIYICEKCHYIKN